jgi:5S rRNA maturation endonuclease (ribonuclease M5)
LTFEQVIERFQARRVGTEYMAKCPTHEDGTASLSIKQEDGKILLLCRAGCDTKDVLGAMGMTFADLFPNGAKANPSPNGQAAPRIVATYDYTDEAGNILFQAVRYDPKKFKQRRSDGKGGWIWNLDGVRLVPYNLPEVLKASSVLVVEGEKDVETARGMGLVATTNPMGALKWKDEYSEFLRGKHVTVIPDSDEPGRKHAEQVARSLVGKAASIAICHLPDRTGKDISDWKLSANSLIELIKAAPAWKPETAEMELFHTPEECENVPDITFSIAGFLQDDGMTFIGGLSGHAKTWIALSIVKALLLGEGTKLWGLFPVSQTAARVIYLIPEVGLSSFMSRARRMGLLPFIRERRLLIRTLSKGPAPDLEDPRLLAAVKDAHVILDTAARFADGEENSASDNARGLAADIFGLLAAGARSIICAHHSPKSFLKENTMSLEGILRGTGDIGAMATTVWGVKQLDEPQNIVYIECVKARDFTHCQPFQIRGRPCIDDSGDFELHRSPGESGNLADEQPAPANESKQREKDDRLAMVRAWLAANPNETAQEQVEKFAALGITVKLDTVQKYRRLVRKGL